MKLTKKSGLTLLGIWLILTGLLQVFSIQIPYIGIILSILAICAGGLLLLGK
jgi:hypothetical protein